MFFPVKLCQVSYRDIEGIRHQCEVRAESLFEAIAAAANIFRKTPWAGHPPGPGCEFTVKLVPETTQSYVVPLHEVEEFAKHGVPKGAPGIIKKQKLRELLGITD